MSNVSLSWYDVTVLKYLQIITSEYTLGRKVLYFLISRQSQLIHNTKYELESTFDVTKESIQGNQIP